ncbi:hypothetical protein IAQ61_008950 [Plenodomus lingam]|uniref:uncharacterized protein n=1 Tax=Leptosphaeria maculans TaxID=5022 RepID=UPI0033336FD6|nr:hypothetical protein IAQ61_008950 [Plenodomus lingam]
MAAQSRYCVGNLAGFRLLTARQPNQAETTGASRSAVGGHVKGGAGQLQRDHALVWQDAWSLGMEVGWLVGRWDRLCLPHLGTGTGIWVQGRSEERTKERRSRKRKEKPGIGKLRNGGKSMGMWVGGLVVHGMWYVGCGMWDVV